MNITETILHITSDSDEFPDGEEGSFFPFLELLQAAVKAIPAQYLLVARLDFDQETDYLGRREITISYQRPATEEEITDHWAHVEARKAEAEERRKEAVRRHKDYLKARYEE